MKRVKPQIPWQLRLASRSLKKKEKLKNIISFLKVKKESKCLEIGCEKGVLGYFLREQGGSWEHSDIDENNVRITKSLLKDKVVLLDPKRFNFSDHTFDCILAVDVLEHVQDDDLFLEEIKRILKKDGRLYITVPKSSRGPFLDRLSRILGVTADFYGHLREGYTLTELEEKLGKAEMEVVASGSYSGFVTELLELLLNAGYVKFSKTQRSKGVKGGISPATPDEFKRNKTAFKIYSLLYPFFYLFSRLDRLCPTGYVLILEAKNKEAV